MPRPRAQTLPVYHPSQESIAIEPHEPSCRISHIFPNKDQCSSPVDDISFSHSSVWDPESRETPPSPSPSKTKVWLAALAPLFLHFALVTSVTALIVFYIHGKDFSIKRRPLIENSTTQKVPFRPTQSDITTFLSSTLVVLRMVAGMWCGALAWRCVFVMLEQEGITLQQIKTMVSLGLPPVPWQMKAPRPKSSVSHHKQPTVLVAVILLLVIPYQISSPILTGSITWTPSSIFISSDLPLTGISTPGDGRSWRNYCVWLEAFTSQITSAGGLASKAWGATTDTSVAKRVVSATQQLPTNSTLNNVTLPYFNIRSIEWVKDPITNGSDKAFAATTRLSFNPFSNVSTTTVGILQDIWELPEDRPFPEPLQIEETRLMAFVYYHTQGNETECYSPTFGTVPSHIGVYKRLITTDYTCYLFAWVTYEAGAATCRDCRVSSPGIVESSRDALEAGRKKDPMTFETLMLMPQVSTSMALMNVSLPNPFGNIEAYAEALLVRSYEASWNALSTGMRADQPETLTTAVKISIPMSRAMVELWRVAVWVALNALLTASGMLFVIVQTRCRKGLVVDTTLAALLLDMTDVVKKGPPGLGEKSSLSRKDSDLVGSMRLLERKGSYSVVLMGEEPTS